MRHLALTPHRSSRLRGLRIRDSPCVQGIGDVITKTHRCVAFPNLYQHQVQPFQLEDPTKPGRRRILVFFLVDPTQKVPSATDVAPQQHEWVTEAMHDPGQNSVFAKLPTELLTMISNENEGTMTRLEAEKYREELMSERSIFVEENDRAYFGMVRTCPWSMETPCLMSWLSYRNSICGKLHLWLMETSFHRWSSFTANIKIVCTSGQSNIVYILYDFPNPQRGTIKRVSVSVSFARNK